MYNWPSISMGSVSTDLINHRLKIFFKCYIADNVTKPVSIMQLGLNGGVCTEHVQTFFLVIIP